MLTKMIRFGKTKIYWGLVICFVIFTYSIGILSSDKLHGPYRFFTNRSNSMNPLIDTGSLIAVKSQPEYNVGDVISFYSKINNREEIITHRIVQIGGNVYVTKGDANQAIDRNIVTPRLVIGKVVAVIPSVGYFLNFVKSPLGALLLIIGPAGLIIVVEVLKMTRIISD